jgi:hypothetical protein
MNLDMLFTHLVAFLAGAIAASALIRWAAERFVDRLLTEIEKEAPPQSPETRLEIEVVDNQVLCYNADTKEYICQGQTLAQVIDNFKQRFPVAGDIKLVPANDDTREWARAQLAKLNETGTSI